MAVVLGALLLSPARALTGNDANAIGEREMVRIIGPDGRSKDATGLRYLGVDIVIDATEGPLVLEVNAQPGLQIQNITGRGLTTATQP